MKLKVFKMYNDSKLPIKAHDGDAGFDLFVHHMENSSHCRVDEVTLYQDDEVTCHTGIRVRIPEGYFMLVAPRSGLATKESVTLMNTPAVVDEPYTGELILKLSRVHPGQTVIHSGDRVAQGLILPVPDVELDEVSSEEELGVTSRGSNGFGSTGMRAPHLGALTDLDLLE